VTTIHLLGSEGFIGSAVQREAKGLHLHCWSHREPDSENYFNLLDSSSWQALLNCMPTHLILLSWPGLPNYQEPFHVSRNLPACVALIEQLVAVGLQRLVVAGTCYEYGLQNGPLREDFHTEPLNCYAIAKDSLRRVIASRYSQIGLQWCWARIFYPFGEGQNPTSLLPSLQRAIDQGDPIFPMSSGRQVRDFVPVEQVAQLLLQFSVNPNAQGIFNCGSGRPTSIRELVEERIAQSFSSIAPELGRFPDREDEPLAFWADTTRIKSLN
jgi:nucleoside-diphosphate-sugar epimerase